MDNNIKDELSVRYKMGVIEYAGVAGVMDACREFEVSQSTFYVWKNKYNLYGKAGLYRKNPIATSHPRKTSPDTVEKILNLRTEYKLGSLRIVYYLARYFNIKISESTVSRILRQHKLNKLSPSNHRRSIPSKRYFKEVPGHHVQIDVKFIILKDKKGHQAKRYQYTAIDDATRIRALKVNSKHNQDYAIEFINYVVEKFPFRIHTVRTDRGHEFQVRFHCHVEDLGISHVYIKPRSPWLNGKVERSHRTDDQEFYQLLTYTDDVDLNEKIANWEHFYNYDRPHISHNGKTPFEVMKSLLVYE